MCGSSGQETPISGEQQSLSALLSADFSERFAQQTSTLQNLNTMLTAIAEAGPDQQGFGSQELAALNTRAGEGVGANYAKGSQALSHPDLFTQTDFHGRHTTRLEVSLQVAQQLKVVRKH